MLYSWVDKQNPKLPGSGNTLILQVRALAQYLSLYGFIPLRVPKEQTWLQSLRLSPVSQ